MELIVKMSKLKPNQIANRKEDSHENYDCNRSWRCTSGMMAAIQRPKIGAKVAVRSEKKRKPGRKLLLYWRSRCCNFTNNVIRRKIVAHILGNGRVPYRRFINYDKYDIIDFFACKCLKLKEKIMSNVPTTHKLQRF